MKNNLRKSRDAKESKTNIGKELNKILTLPDSKKKYDYLEKFKNKYPKYSRIYFELGSLAATLAEWDISRNWYELFFKISDKKDNIHNAIAYSNFANILAEDYFKEYDLAKTYYEKAIELLPDSASTYNNLACLLDEHLKEYDLAKKCYEKAIELDSNYNEAYSNFASLLAGKYFKEYDLAKENYEKAVELNPNDAVTFNNFAILLTDDHFKQFHLAKKYYEKAIKLDSNYYLAYSNLANLLTNNYFKEYDFAKKLCEKAIELKPDYWGVYNNLANLLKNDYFREYDLAKKNYEKAIELNSNDAEVYYNFASLLSENYFKEYDLAKRYYEKAIEFKPDFAYAYNNLGILCYEKLKDYKQARDYLEKGLKLDKNSEYLHLSYAELLANFLNEKEKAKYHFNKAIELNKNKEVTKDSQEQLRELAFEGNFPTYLSNIKVNKILHLKDFEIEIDKKELKHLLITGHNGCGKTILMNRLRNYLQKLILCEADVAIMHNFEKDLDAENPDLISIQPSAKTLYYKYRSGYFVIAHFDARRKLKLEGIRDVENIQIETYSDIVKPDGETKYTNLDFLKFAVNQYVQAGLAARKKDEVLEGNLNRWIENFEKILKIIDNRIEKIDLEVKPNYHFVITPKAPYEAFTFEHLADGFSSIFSIVAELMLRMHNKAFLSYDVEGLVLLDEPEAHLHLETQKQLLPKLTQIFPKVQFIVATHSPFILNSLSNAVIYDLEKRERFEDASLISYWGLVESYFESNQYSKKALNDIKEYEKLVDRYLTTDDLTSQEFNRMELLRMQFENMPAYFSKELSIKFNQIELKRLNYD